MGLLVGNVLRRHGIPPAPERKRRTTWAEFIRLHLALLAGTDISSAEVKGAKTWSVTPHAYKRDAVRRVLALR